MSLTHDLLLEMYRRMLRIRRFDEEAGALLAADTIVAAVRSVLPW